MVMKNCEPLVLGPALAHREKEGLVVSELEVLVGELVAVDGTARSAMVQRQRFGMLTLPPVPLWSKASVST